MLYKRKTSKYWWTRFTAPDGREIRQSTGTTDKARAEEYEVRLKDQTWRQHKLGERQRRTWKESVVRWIEEGTKRTMADDIGHFKWLDTHLGGLYLDDIDRETLDGIIRAKQAKGSSAGTVNRMMAVVRAVLRRAEREWGWIDKAPAVRRLREEGKRIRWITRAEADTLLGKLPPHLAAMARFTLATGLRESNVTGLEWSQVDLRRRVCWIHPDQAKAGRGIGIPLNREAMVVLRQQIGHHPERVFTFRKKPVAKAGTRAWKNALADAGIKDFRWHDLRHTWASWHVQSGTPLHVLQELGGWASCQMVLRYAHLAPEHLAKHADRIARFRTISGTPGTEKKKAVKP